MKIKKQIVILKKGTDNKPTKKKSFKVNILMKKKINKNKICNIFFKKYEKDNFTYIEYNII